MNYEEKYKEAIKRAKAMIKVAEKEEEVYKSAITIFPELRESEDERIRKEIIELVHFFYGSSSVYEHHVSEDDMIAWLEKQGDIIDLKEYAKGILKGAAIHLILWIDENLADGKMCLSNMECEDLEDAMVNAKWDKIYKYIKKKIEKQDEKPAWSEEDEEMVDFMIEFIESLWWRKDLTQRKDNVLSWLKSIKSNHWKSSEELLKDLPKWKKMPNGIQGNGDFKPTYLVKSYGHYLITPCLSWDKDSMYIELSELEKLPKEE